MISNRIDTTWPDTTLCRSAQRLAHHAAVAGAARRGVRPQGGLLRLGAGSPPVLHRQADPNAGGPRRPAHPRSEEHTSALQSLMRISYAVFCLKQKQAQNVN